MKWGKLRAKRMQKKIEDLFRSLGAIDNPNETGFSPTSRCLMMQTSWGPFSILFDFIHDTSESRAYSLSIYGRFHGTDKQREEASYNVCSSKISGKYNLLIGWRPKEEEGAIIDHIRGMYLPLRPLASPCELHKGNPSQCPQAHVCECGAVLSSHSTTSANCPCRKGNFRPDKETLKKFPSEYEHNHKRP